MKCGSGRKTIDVLRCGQKWHIRKLIDKIIKTNKLITPDRVWSITKKSAKDRSEEKRKWDL